MWYLIVALVAPALIVLLQRLSSVWNRNFRNHKLALSFLSVKSIIDLSANYPKSLFMQLGPYAIVTIQSPEHMRIVLNSPHCQGKSMHYDFFRVSQGLFAAPAQIWKHERKVFNPCFGPALLPKFVNIFNVKMLMFVQLLQEHVGEERNFLFEISRCFIDIILSTAFGVDLNIQKSAEGTEYAKAQDEFVHLTTFRVVCPWKQVEFLYRLTPSYKRECEILKLGYDFIEKILLKHAENNVKSTDKDSKLFIDKLLELNGTKEEQDIQYLRDHLITIMLAGSDTSMSTAGNTMLMLAIHQDIQERVYQELMEVIGPDQNAPISMEDAAKLTYMEMVCKETMRLFPVAGIIGRKATQSIVLDANTTIPAGAVVVPVFYQLHRDPEIWGPNAAEFDPERFQPEVAAGRHPYAYLPFSGGPRMCLGMRYAWLSMKIMLGHVLRRYRLKTTLTMDTIEIDYSILMRIKQGCQIRLEER